MKHLIDARWRKGVETVRKIAMDWLAATPICHMAMGDRAVCMASKPLFKWPIKQLITAKFAFRTRHHEEESTILFARGNDLNSLCSLFCEGRLDAIMWANHLTSASSLIRDARVCPLGHCTIHRQKLKWANNIWRNGKILPTKRRGWKLQGHR